MQGKKHWIDTRLQSEEMNFLDQAMLEARDSESYNSKLAGNISNSQSLQDKDNWFYETVLKPLTEKMFYREENNYYKYHVEKEESPPEFGLDGFWVNYMKQHEFNPLHSHSGLFSFVIFVKIPTHWEEQHALPFSVNSNSPVASDFVFVRSEKDSELCENTNFSMSPEDEGRMLFFPAWLKHMVYPFYGTEEERITISGNIDFVVSKEIKKFDSTYTYEEKEKMLEMLGNSIKLMKKELIWMKKEMEKGGLN